MLKPTRYEPETEITVCWNAALVMNYFEALQETIDKEELEVVLGVQSHMNEFANVGAGLGGGFENKKELRVLKYEEAISGPDAEAWKKEFDKEHERMVKHKTWVAVPRLEKPKGVTKSLDST